MPLGLPLGLPLSEEMASVVTPFLPSLRQPCLGNSAFSRQPCLGTSAFSRQPCLGTSAFPRQPFLTSRPCWGGRAGHGFGFLSGFAGRCRLSQCGMGCHFAIAALQPKNCRLTKFKASRHPKIQIATPKSSNWNFWTFWTFDDLYIYIYIYLN